MKLVSLGAVALTALLTGCAASPELVSCLQPNRRVTVEVGGLKERPTKPGAKRARPQSVMSKADLQGDNVFEYGSAELKAGGKAELDKLVNTLNKGTRRDKRPTKVSSVIISGHIDRTEFEDGMTDLDERRARGPGLSGTERHRPESDVLGGQGRQTAGRGHQVLRRNLILLRS